MNLDGPLGPADARSREQLVVLAVVLVATAAAALLYGAANIPLIGDNQHYFYMAERTASGLSPHDGHFDPKTSLPILLSGAAMRGGRLLGVSDLMASRFLSWLVLAATIWTVWRLARKLTGASTAAVLSLIAMFGFQAYVYLALMGCRPKVFLALPVALTLLLRADRRWFATGVTASFAFLCWQPASLMFAILVLTSLFHRERIKRVGLALLGGTLAVAAFELYFVAMGATEQQLAQNVTFPLAHMSSHFRGVVAALGRLAGLWAHGFGAANILPALVVVGLVGYTAALLRGKWRDRVPDGTHGAWIYFLACLGAGLAFTFYDQQGVPDLFLLLPFVAVVAGHVLFSASRRAGGGLPLVIAASAIYLLVLATAGIWRANPVDYDLADQQRLAARVGVMLEKQESVYAIGCTHLLGMNHAPNWCRYGFFFRGVDDHIRETTGGAPFTPEKDGRWPAVILLSRRPPQGSDGWLGARYTEASEPEFERQGIRVFTRR